MPVLARCPMCRAVLPAGSADAAGEVRCPRCAEMVLPATRKFCARCSRDVTRERRMKDAAGEYYCPDCWSGAREGSGKQALFTCRSCGASLPESAFAGEGDGTLCSTCRAARDLTPETVLSAASDLGGDHVTVPPEVETFSQQRARQRRRSRVRVALWLAGAIVVAAVIVAIVLLAR